MVSEQAGADFGTFAGQEVQDRFRNTGLIENVRAGHCGQCGALGGFGDNCIAGNQRRSDLAAKYRDRKIPGADAHKNAPPGIMQLIDFSGRAWQIDGFVKQFQCVRCIIAAKIHRFAHFVQCIPDCASAFPHAKRYQRHALLFHEIGGFQQTGRTVFNGLQTPILKTGDGGIQCISSRFLVAVDHFANDFLMIVGCGNRLRPACACLAVNPGAAW